MIAVDEGRVRDAVSMLNESHRIHRDLDDPIGIARGLSRVARVLAVVGRAGTAARLLSRAEYLHEELGARLRPWLAQMNGETVTTIRAQLDEAAFAEAWEQGRALTADAAVTLALDSLTLGPGGPQPPSSATRSQKRCRRACD